MKFKLIEKTEEEIENIRQERRIYSRRVKGVANSNVCPLTVILASGREVEVWDLTEQDIVNLVMTNAKEEKENKRDDVGRANSFKILKCWREKHPTVSADFVETFYKMRDMFEDSARECVRDMLIPVVSKTETEAKVLAKYLKGMKNDFSKVTESEIVKTIKEQERQRKEIEKKNSNEQ